MKKRLLSAVLALAMALTLLPLSAFAADAVKIDYQDPEPGKSITYYSEGASLGNNVVADRSGWFWNDSKGSAIANWHEVTTGVISSTGTSGAWYPTIDAAYQKNAQYIKLFGSSAVNYGGSGVAEIDTHNVTIDLNGRQISGLTSAKIKAGYTLNITDSSKSGTNRTTLSAMAIELGNGSTFTATNVDLGSTSITGSFTTSAKVSLTNSATSGDIVLNGSYGTNNTSSGGEVSLTYASSAKDIRIIYPEGSGTSSGGSISLSNVSSAQNLEIRHSGTVGSSSGGSITLNNSTASSSTITSQYGGSFSATDARSAGEVRLYGADTKLTATNSTLGNILLFGTTKSAVATAHPTAPTVTLSGQSTCGLISQDSAKGTEAMGSPYVINIRNATASQVNLPYATVNIEGGKVTGATNLKGGTLNLTGDGVTMGNTITLGDSNSGSAVTLNATGTHITTSNIGIAGTGRHVNLNIGSSMTNNFGGTINVGNVVNGNATVSIQGGNYQNLLDESYIPNMQYLVTVTTGSYRYSYYNANQMNELVSLYQAASSNKPSIQMLRQTGNRDKTLVLVDDRDSSGNKELLRVSYANNDETTFILPTMASDMKSVQWAKKNGSGEVIQVYSGASPFRPVPADYDNLTLGGNRNRNEVTLYVQNASYAITKINQVRVDVTKNPRVTASLSGNVITLTGTLDDPSGTSSIPLILETDNGDVTVTVSHLVGGGASNRTFFVNDVYPKGAMTVAIDGSALIVGNSRYTVDGSGLHSRNQKLVRAGGQVITTVGTTVDDTARGRYDLGKSMSSDDGFDISLSPAILQALGRVEASVTDTDISNWIAQAQRKAWDKLPANKGKTPKTGEIETTGYSTVYLVPYLDVQLSSWNPRSDTGLLTATLIPSYKIEVRSSNTTYSDLFKNATWTDGDVEPLNGAIVLKKASLGTLASDMGKVTIRMKVPGFTTNAPYVHQGNTYVSQGTVTSGRVTFDLFHTAVSGAGLGVVQLNTQKPLVTLTRTTANANLPNVEAVLYYDTLQAAVNDAMDKDTITLDHGYKSADTITVTGRAREITIQALGNTGVSLAAGATGATVTPVTTGTGATGRTYLLQLARDNYVSTTTPQQPQDNNKDENKNEVIISVVQVANGSASVSAGRAKVGDIITVATSPAKDYVFSGLTIRTNTGANVGYTTVSTNNFRFTVPAGATSITVTPAFAKAAATGATVVVSNVTNGTATTSAGDNRVPGGTNVTVTVSPNTGYRTMGLYVTSDVTTTTNATRTGVNTFTFTVPNSATNVVVTPRFDVNNGTVFEDVWSTEYFSSPVAWAVGRGVTEGTSTYQFSPYNNCTRADMVTFLWRAAGRPAVTGVRNPFWDVQAGTYYYDAVLWAVSKGITNGVESNRFGVNEYVTRGQAVTFLYRYENSPAVITSNVFYDVSAKEYYAKAVSWASAKGVTNGTSATLFSPNQFVTRAQAVTFLYRDITGARA